MGVASGAAMLPYTVIKEANPPELGGSATGVINFINFTFSALLGPVFGSRLVQVPGDNDAMALAHYQAGFEPLLYGIVLALVLTFFLKETGPAARRAAAAMIDGFCSVVALGEVYQLSRPKEPADDWM